MKTSKFILLMILATGFFTCNKNDIENGYNQDVETYIELLKTNQYESSKLPEFSSNDIPALLKYINDSSIVNKFPHHPASSFAPQNPEYRLGVLVLWTIESVRVTEGSDKLFWGFPSQHPFVQTRSEPIEWVINHDDEVYDTIKLAYSIWWKNNENKKFSNFCNIDPLENTNYSWH